MSTRFLGQRFVFTQPDGSTIDVRGWGDQNYAVFETPDGFSLTRNPSTGFWELAQVSADRTRLEPVPGARTLPDGGRSVVRPGVRIDREGWRAAAIEGSLRFGGRRCDERRRERLEAMRAMRTLEALGGPLMAPPQRTTVGDYVGLCLLIDFSDAAATISRDEVDRFCNLQSYSGFGNKGSVRDYFFDNSLGRLRYTNLVTPYYRAKKPKSYYTSPGVTYGLRARELIGEALAHWKTQGFSFSTITADGTGKVYATNVFYAGGVTNNWGEGLWPHASALGSAITLAPGIAAFDYQVTALGSELSLGTFCHENGHMLCDYPDLYDYGDESSGVGNYCLMCAGNHADQKNPTQICSYLKRLSGWAGSVVSLQHGAVVTLQAAQNQFAIFSKSNEEYFIIENRDRTGRDAALPGAGLAIWHVDETGNNSNEQMSASSHYEIALEQADGLFQLETTKYLAGDAQDLYPTGAASFADDTTPASRWWDGTSSHLKIDTISPPGPTMNFRCTFSNVAIGGGGGGGGGGATLQKQSSPAVAIPDNQGAGVSDVIQVPESLTIAEVKVGVNIAHTYVGDLVASLLTPWGTEIMLHAKGEGGNQKNLKVAYDSSGMPPLAVCRGRSTQGAWRLQVKDVAPVDSGTLNSWSLEFTPQVATVTPVVLQESLGTPIPDNTPAGIERSLATNSAGKVGDIEVDVAIAHTYIGDLRVALVSPAGVEVVLHDRSGAQEHDISKTYTRETTPGLAGLVGTTIAGAWKLRVSDNEAIDTGKITSWKVAIQPV